MLATPVQQQMYLKALIVEDDPITQIIHQRLLKTLHIDSILTSTGMEAIQALKHLTFDFVLMDINMPVQDGLDACRWIRQENDITDRDILIIALTSFSSSEHTKEILDAGMNEHLTKPLVRDELMKILQKYFWSKEPPPNVA